MITAYFSIGISHWKSPLAVREQFSLSREKSEFLIKEALAIGVKVSSPFLHVTEHNYLHWEEISIT